MAKKLLVERSISIKAPAARVWEVLVNPVYIRLWDDLPPDYPADEWLHPKTTITWIMPGEKFTRLTVTIHQEPRRLQLTLFDSTWSTPPLENIAYTYNLSGQNGTTELFISIGDFSSLPDGEKYYEASLEFVAKATEKIKELAEQ